MQHVTKQHRIEGFIRRRKTRPVIVAIIDRSFSAPGQVDTHGTLAQHRAEMMRDKPIATTDVQNLRSMRHSSRDFQGHVISAADFAPPPFALEAADDSVYKRP